MEMGLLNYRMLQVLVSGELLGLRYCLLLRAMTTLQLVVGTSLVFLEVDLSLCYPFHLIERRKEAK